MKIMKTFLFKPLSWTALCLSMLLLAACSSNDPLGELANSELQQRPEPQALTRFSSGIKPSNGPRKTLMDRGGNFYWTPGDKIWVKDGARYTQDAQNSIMAVQESADFYLPGTMTATEYTVFYTGQSSPEASSTSTTSLHVKISGTQEQTIPNNAEHFANSGDCGTARATHEGDGSYNFQLTHKASYLIFAPKSPNVEKAGKCILKKITVESTGSSNLCGTYDFTTGELNTGSVTSAGKKITLTVGKNGEGLGSDFPVPTTQDISVNGAFMVIQPGTHALKVTYTVNYYGIDQEYTQNISPREFKVNKYYTVGHSLTLNVPEHVFYFPEAYFMWDAQKWYWHGEDDYPTTTNVQNSFYPRSQSEDPLRWYNAAASGAAANSCKDMPNANELSWYVEYGDPHYDGTTLWSLGGIKQRGGVWLKKKSVIIEENSGVANLFSKTVGSDGKNWTTTQSSISKTPTTGKPADTSKYFFLPQMGWLYEGELNQVGVLGWYWSSTMNPSNSGRAYSFMVYKSYIGVNSSEHTYAPGYSMNTLRPLGIIGGKRPNGSDWFQ